MVLVQVRKLIKLYRGREEWVLGLVPTAGLSMLVAGMVCIGALVVASELLRADGRHISALSVAMLFFDVVLAAAASFAYIFVSSRRPRPPQLHSHGLSLLMMLISFTFYIVAGAPLLEGRCALRGAAAAARLMFFGLYKAVFLLLMRKRLKAMGPSLSCCVHASRWCHALVASVVAGAAAGGLIYLLATVLALGGVPCAEIIRLGSPAVLKAEVPVAAKAMFLCFLLVFTLGVVGSFITGFGTVVSAWLLTNHAISKLAKRKVAVEELSRVGRQLRRHLLGIVFGITSTQIAIVGTSLGDPRLISDDLEQSRFASKVAATIDVVGDLIGIFLLSGIGVLLIREDPTAGDVSGHIRGLLHSAVLTSRAQMAFEGRVDKSSKFCVASFPGKYLEDWHALTWACEQGDVSSACVFLPTTDPQQRFGRHVDAPETPGKCWCYSLYGKEQPWGCMWFQSWKENVERAVEMGLPLMAVFFPGQVGKGVVRWEDLGTADLWDGVGLGGSQKAEVAYLKMRGFGVVEEDLAALRRQVTRRILRFGVRSPRHVRSRSGL